MNPSVWPDLVNGTLELSGGGFISISVWRLYRDKLVRGVSYVHVGFFTAWGFWNLFFYPNYDLWLSFWGGAALVAVNTIWLGQLLYYTIRERRL